MSTTPGRRGYLLLLLLVLLFCVLTEQFWLVRLFPFLGSLGGIQPMIVFLDIPLRLPVIDWLPVGILLTAGYLVVISPDITRHHPQPGKMLRKKALAVFSAWWILLVCILAAGGLFSLLEDQLPKNILNGIDSFGLRADLFLPWPSPVIFHLHGSMLMGASFALGLWILSRKAAISIPQVARPEGTPVHHNPVPAQSAPPPPAIKQTPRQSTPPAQNRIPESICQTHIPEPVPAKKAHVSQPSAQPIAQQPASRARTSLVAVVAPQIPGKGNSFPCIVRGEIKPA